MLGLIYFLYLFFVIPFNPLIAIDTCEPRISDQYRACCSHGKGDPFFPSTWPDKDMIYLAGKILSESSRAETPQAKELDSGAFQLILSDQAADSGDWFGAKYGTTLGVHLKDAPRPYLGPGHYHTVILKKSLKHSPCLLESKKRFNSPFKLGEAERKSLSSLIQVQGRVGGGQAAAVASIPAPLLDCSRSQLLLCGWAGARASMSPGGMEPELYVTVSTGGGGHRGCRNWQKLQEAARGETEATEEQGPRHHRVAEAGTGRAYCPPLPRHTPMPLLSPLQQ